MSKPQSVTVLGTGSAGSRHCHILRQLGAEVIAISVRPERREQLSRAGFDCAQNLAEARQAGARGAVVATDTGRHLDDTRTAIRLGMHVLCEKPLATSAKDAVPLRMISEELHTFPACCLRFEPGLRAFRTRLPEIGDVHSIRIECRSYLPEWRPGRDFRKSYSARAGEGGVLLDLIHEVDYALWLFGAPSCVSGFLRNTGRLGIESAEQAYGTWSTASGATASIELDYLSRLPVRRIRAAGSRGELRYDFLARQLVLNRLERRVHSEVFPGEREDMYIEQMREFLTVLGGRPPRHLATLEDGVLALAVCDAWKRSAESRRQEKVAMP